MREAIGYGIDLGVEIHRNLSPDEAIMLARELEPLRLLYYEDPVAPESLPALEYVARHVDIPIAFGERSHSLSQFKDLVDTRTVAMIRPDLSLAGGFTQCRKIAAYAEASFVNVFPHLMGSPVNVAAFAQFAASIPNYALMESGSSLPRRDRRRPAEGGGRPPDGSRSARSRRAAARGGARPVSLPAAPDRRRDPVGRLGRALKASEGGMQDLVLVGTYTDPSRQAGFEVTPATPVMGMTGPTGSAGIYVLPA